MHTRASICLCTQRYSWISLYTSYQPKLTLVVATLSTLRFRTHQLLSKTRPRTQRPYHLRHSQNDSPSRQCLGPFGRFNCGNMAYQHVQWRTLGMKWYEGIPAWRFDCPHQEQILEENLSRDFVDAQDLLCIFLYIIDERHLWATLIELGLKLIPGCGEPSIVVDRTPLHSKAVRKDTPWLPYPNASSQRLENGPKNEVNIPSTPQIWTWNNMDAKNCHRSRKHLFELKHHSYHSKGCLRSISRLWRLSWEKIASPNLWSFRSKSKIHHASENYR